MRCSFVLICVHVQIRFPEFMQFQVLCIKPGSTLRHIWRAELPVRSCKGFQLGPISELFTYLNTFPTQTQRKIQATKFQN